MPTQRSCPQGFGLRVPVGNWSPSLNSAYSQYSASAPIDCTPSASTTQAHTLTIVSQEELSCLYSTGIDYYECIKWPTLIVCGLQEEASLYTKGVLQDD